MCARFELNTKVKDLVEEFEISNLEEITWAPQFRPYGKAPVIVQEGAGRILKLMEFALIPSWSKEKRIKFSTYNARLTDYDEKKKKEVSIYEKPTWRASFAARRCLVPMTHFIEPIYTGEYAGHWVRFSEKKNQILVAAGIWEEWISKEDGEVIESFAIITDDPIPFVEKMGHGRSPLFISDKAFQSWLEPIKKDPKDLVTLLSHCKVLPTISAEKDEAMKPGWEKRVKDHAI